MRILSLALFLLLLSLACLPHGTAGTDDPVRPAVRPIVIAYPDTGVNPYHLAFREPSWQDHPSTYIDGYPEDARPLHLSLDAGSYDEAREKDRAAWEAMEPGVLYFVPGTRLVGIMTDSKWNSQYASDSHGTLVADAGSGSQRGTAPNSAIVAPLWAAMYRLQDAKWIDAISVSLGCLVPALGGVHATIEPLHWNVNVTTAAVQSYHHTQRGALYLNGGGNGNYVGTNFACDRNPPWNVNVGEVHPHDHHWLADRDRPVDVAAVAQGQWARHDSIDETKFASGTSISTPRVAGLAARLIETARATLGHEGGIQDGKLAIAPLGHPLPPTGPLADGDLTSEEVKHLLFNPARDVSLRAPTAFNPIPPTPAPDGIAFHFAGYGWIGEETYAESEALLLGHAEPQDRPYDDYWYQQYKSAGWEYWYPLVCKTLHQPDQWARCTDKTGSWIDPLDENPFIPETGDP